MMKNEKKWNDKINPEKIKKTIDKIDKETKKFIDKYSKPVNSDKR